MLFIEMLVQVSILLKKTLVRRASCGFAPSVALLSWRERPQMETPWGKGFAVRRVVVRSESLYARLDTRLFEPFILRFAGIKGQIESSLVQVALLNYLRDPCIFLGVHSNQLFNSQSRR